MSEAELIKTIQQKGIIAVLVIDKVENAVPLAHALLKGNVNILELALRTPVSIDALQKIKTSVPKIIAGAGTILSVQQVQDVKRAGANFGVAPGMNPNVIKAAQKVGLPFYPGIATPSDIEVAVELGCSVLKFFPAEPSGGLAYLKSIAAPYAHLELKYIPLGGLNLTNFKNYLEFPNVIAVGGSWIATRQLIENKDWKTITENALAATRIVREIKENLKT
jgi:2-dehydro-3-deoxyphosphogluconate aldolase/(4S)-4-hydroxy-2-oxoglutarate aldolase